MKKILLIDNYDSFTYNIVQYVENIIGYPITVKKNNTITVDEVDDYDILLLSPGPGLPKDAGILIPTIQRYANQKPILGICLGLQAMVEAFGGQLKNLDRVYHGVANEVTIIKEDLLFKNLPKTISVARYHSWVADPIFLPHCFTVTCVDTQGEIMAITHRNYFMKAVQFHPESILTPQGKQILSNFLQEALNT